MQKRKAASGSRLEIQVERWRKELLDTSLRSRLMNCPDHNPKVVKILRPGMEDLYEQIVCRERKPDFACPVTKETDYRAWAFLKLMEILSCPVVAERGEIFTENADKDTCRVLEQLRNKAMLAGEEQGIHSLYAVFGFVLWRDPGRPARGMIRSPLLMVPVEILHRTPEGSFKLSKAEGEIEVNPLLSCYFETSFGIRLPVFRHEGRNSLKRYLEETEEILAERGWTLLWETCLGNFSFSKVEMFKDLDTNRDKILRHPVLRMLSGELDELPQKSDAVRRITEFVIFDADESQREAVMRARRGCSFVLQGPPGTGKSQTIANIIAAALEDGKTVLFVSEKTAALKIVYDRLCTAGLENFCLFMNDMGTGRKKSARRLAAPFLKHRAETGRNRKETGECCSNRPGDSLKEETDQFQEIAWFLNRYSEEMNTAIEPLGKSIYEVIGRLAVLENVPASRSSIPHPELVTSEEFEKMLFQAGIEGPEGAGHRLRIPDGNRLSEHLGMKAGSPVSDRGAWEKETAKTWVSLRERFEKSFLLAWLDAVLKERPVADALDGRTHDQFIQVFRELAQRRLQDNAKELRDRLALKTDLYALRDTAAARLLLREGDKSRSLMPVRKLFSMASEAVLAANPCIMMSPLSVARFLDADRYHFDMVIFDEASQVCVHDAAGAILRADQAVIAGDINQLPPTMFFQKLIEENDGDYTDAPGITHSGSSLLELAGEVLPEHMLSWHYRSRHEGLIAFSNKYLYAGRLITLPESDPGENNGVEFIHVPEGVYEGGRKRCNYAEAEKCARLVEEHLQQCPERSLGIIAFSEKQQMAIAEKVRALRLANPGYEPFFKEDKKEPFFIRNLENVQGDERDTIIFSIGYARTKEQIARGKQLPLRFGPLGTDGGEKRLNVAVTRARINMKLISSILPSEIDIRRTESEGIYLLKRYMEFVRHPFKPETEREAAYENRLADEIAHWLVSQGYRIRRNLGSSRYRIDIAVEDPSDPGIFIAGIECDGPMYALGRSAEDRDLIRSRVLTDMGWRLFRVWAPEWLKDPESVRASLKRFLDVARTPKEV